MHVYMYTYEQTQFSLGIKNKRKGTKHMCIYVDMHICSYVNKRNSWYTCEHTQLVCVSNYMALLRKMTYNNAENDL